jgi:hypothetical protein
MFGRRPYRVLFRHHFQGRHLGPRAHAARAGHHGGGQLKSAAEKKSRAELDRLAEEKQAALG